MMGIDQFVITAQIIEHNVVSYLFTTAINFLFLKCPPTEPTTSTFAQQFLSLVLFQPELDLNWHHLYTLTVSFPLTSRRHASFKKQTSRAAIILNPFNQVSSHLGLQL